MLQECPKLASRTSSISQEFFITDRSTMSLVVYTPLENQPLLNRQSQPNSPLSMFTTEKLAFGPIERLTS